MPQQVYAIRNEDPWLVKIGVSVNPLKRVSAVKSGAARIIIVREPPVPRLARAVEKWAHFRLRERHIEGEWFFATDSETLDAIDRAAKISYALYRLWLEHPKESSAPKAWMPPMACGIHLFMKQERTRKYGSDIFPTPWFDLDLTKK